MIEISDWQKFPHHSRGGVLCVGNFDGVHVGHGKMLATGRQEAQRRGASFTIMTFHPHPAVILKPQTTRIPLTTLDQRRELLAAFSPDVLLVVPTTPDFLGISAEAFLRDIVVGNDLGGMGARLMVEGPTFTFGKGARGNVEMLAQQGHTLGIETIVVATQEVALSDLTLVNVSSSLTRWLVEQGRMRDAARCLGRPYAVRGEVVRGQQRGKTLGFPTANVAAEQLVPAAGVYAGHARIVGQEGLWKAAISIGTNPTFDGKATTVEAHLLDFAGDLYGRTIEVHFTRWIREMVAFGGVGPLVEWIKKDVADVRAGEAASLSV